MLFIILGLIGYLASYFLPTNPNFSSTRFAPTVRVFSIGLLALGVFSSCIRQIDAGEVGVQKLFGDVKEGYLESGLHVVNPLVELVKLNTRTQNYTMSAISSEGKVRGDDAIRVLSTDGLELIIDLTVLYHLEKAQTPKIVREIGPNIEEVIVRPISRTKIRDNAVNFTAIELYSTRRSEFQAKIYHDIDSLFNARGVQLEQILVRNITLPESVKLAIESKINAEQDAQKMQYVLQKEKQEADRKRVEAQGIADYQKILSTGLSDKLLQYEAIKAQKEVALSPNSKVIIMNGKSSPQMLLSN